MRIGFDAKRAFNNNTGLGNYSRFVLHSLKKIDSTTFFCLFTTDVNEKRLEEFDAFEVIKQKRFIPKFLWRSWLIKSSLKKADIDIFHGLSNELPFGIKQSEIKTVVTIHDLIFLRYPHFYSVIDRAIYNFKFKYACHKADKIVAISEQTKQEIIHFYGIDSSKIEVVYQACNPLYLNESPIKAQVKTKYGLQRDFIVCVGTIEPRKNQLNLIKAFQEIKNEAVELVIVGRGKAYKKEVERYLAENNITNVKILSDVSNEEVAALYQSALVAVYLPLFEGFGIPILEAICSKTAVLTTDGQCFKEAGGKAAAYVNPTKINDISSALAKLIGSKEEREHLIYAQTEHLLKFDQDLLAQKLMNIYQQLM